jgi:hypothetical protein
MLVVCCYEDRARDLVGLKLLVLSLKRHCPSLAVRVASPCADDRCKEFLQSVPNVTLVPLKGSMLSGWDVKPLVLLDTLQAGATAAVWLDSDILVNGDAEEFLRSFGDNQLVAAQERPWVRNDGGTLRTRLWGLPVGRSVPRTVNTCVLRVTAAHRELLQAWAACLRDSLYQRAQRQPVMERPFHLFGDQEVLTALLGSAQFAHIPIRYLLRGRDIAHCFHADGYTVGERVRNLGRGLPLFVHGQGPRVWDLQARRDMPYLDVSAFLWLARQYRDDLRGDVAWMDPLPGRAEASQFGESPNLLGMSLALRSQLRRVGIRSALRRACSRRNVCA